MRAMIFIFTCLFCSINLYSFDFHYNWVPELQSAGFGDERGLVVRTFKIKVPGVSDPYNPSIIRHYDGYLLSFRHDFPWNGIGAVIGLLKLDMQFKPVGDKMYVNTKNNSSEDARLFKAQSSKYLIYTNVKGNAPLVCNMAVTQLHNENLAVLKRKDIEFKLNLAEKNWTPFVWKNPQSGLEEAYLIYRYVPFQIVRLNLPLNGTSEMIHGHPPGKPLKNWEKKWGKIRGGSSAIRVGDEYLTFFHSSFMSGGIRYYVMGALMFDSKPPFQITRVSPCPILFKGIYKTDVTPRVWFYPRNHLRVLFPGGATEGVENGRGVFYVVCGENDVAIKCVVLDKDNLLNGLVRMR